MSTRSGPIYENRVFVVPELLADYESWLDETLDHALEFPGLAEV